jgi:hypothetical protein
MGAMMAKGIGFSGLFRIAANTERIGKERKCSENSRTKPGRVDAAGNAG